MTTWFTADLHLGHANIIGYCARPYADVAEMDAALIDGWNDTVDEDDTVWVLGDVALGSIEHGMRAIGRLRGRKLLVPGNHDRCWRGWGRRAEEWAERYLAAGFESVRQGPVQVRVGGHPALADHFPYQGDSQAQDRFVEHRPVDRGSWLLHGHVHEQWGQRHRMINVGVDVCGYRPIAEESVAALITAGPADRPTLVESATGR